jgi:hypothetical protein
VIVNVFTVKQLALILAVTVIVAEIGEVVVLVAVKEGMGLAVDIELADPNPIAVFELVQL